MPSSKIREMFNLAAKMHNVINFGLGEPAYTAAEHITSAAIEAIETGKTHYTLNSGILPLREILSEKMKIKKNVEYDPESEIMITSGGVEALFLSLRVILDPGDEVILGAPYFSNYIGQIEMCGAVPVIVDLLEKDQFQYDVDNLRKAVTSKTKIILINSPSNPTGSVTPEKVLREIANLCIEKDLYLITDEVYQDFIYGSIPYFSVASVQDMKERTIIIDSFSKTYAMTGWRCGFILGPNHIVKQAIKIQENVVSCVNTPTQYAAISALEGEESTLKEMIAQYAINRELVVQEIDSIPLLSCIIPQGAFYAFINISKTEMSSENFAIQLLKETGVVLVPGSGFGEAGEGFVRMSYVSDPEITKEGLKRIRHFMIHHFTSNAIK